MIKLFQFPSSKLLPNLSPFCMKLETYLRMAKIPHEIVSTMKLSQAPRGQLPYIKDGNVTLGDSSLIIEYLGDKYGDILDDHLTPKEKAVSLAFQCLLENHLYWIMFYSRWIDRKGWATMKKLYLKSLPRAVRLMVTWRIHRKVTRTFKTSPFGRHNQDELYAIGCQDIDAISHFLGNSDYMLSDTPTSIDACCYAFLANILLSPFDNPVKQYTAQNSQLIEYCERMKQRFYFVK